jgi:hypothetical protein
MREGREGSAFKPHVQNLELKGDMQVVSIAAAAAAEGHN